MRKYTALLMFKTFWSRLYSIDLITNITGGPYQRLDRKWRHGDESGGFQERKRNSTGRTLLWRRQAEEDAEQHWDRRQGRQQEAGGVREQGPWVPLDTGVANQNA